MFFISLKTKMSIIVSLLVACLLSLMTFSTLAAVERQLKTSISAQQATLTSAMAKELDYKISLYRNELVEVAKSVSPGMLADRHEAQRFIDSRLDTISMFDSGLFLFSPDGRMLAGTLPARTVMGKSSAFRLAVEKAVQAKEFRISEPFFGENEQGHPIVMFSAPVLDAKGEVTAVLAGKLDLMKENFLGEVAAVKIGESGYFFIFNQDRMLIIHPDKSRVLTTVPAGVNKSLEKATGGFEGTEENTNSRGLHVLSSFRRLKSTNWIFSANYPLHEAYAPIARAKQTMLIALLFMVAASILVVWVAVRYLLAPLLSFTSHVLTLSGNEVLPKPVQIHTHDEIEGLATAFNRLMADITRHKNSIQEEKEFELSLIQHSSLSTFVIDANHRLLHWNKACEVLTGIPRKEIIGTDDHWKGFYDHKRPTLADMVIDGRYEQLAAIYPLSEQRADGLHAEGWYAQLNGKERYLSFYAAPIYGSKGELVAAIETVEDITERKKTEETLRKLSCAVDQSPNAVVITDIMGIIDYVNPEFSALTGFLPEEVIGKNPRLLQSGEMSHEHFKKMWGTISSGLEWSGEFLNKKKSGELYWESASIFPVKNEVGVISHYVALKEDISDQKLADENIRQALSLLNATLESTADGILVRDMAGKLVTYNRKFVAMWRLSESLLVLGDDRQLRLSVQDQLREPEKFLEITDKLYNHPELESVDILEFKDGRVFERVSKPQIVENQIVGRVISFRDITERKNSEKLIEALHRKSQVILESAGEGIYGVDLDGKTTFVNPAATKMTGYEPEEIIGKFQHALIHHTRADGTPYPREECLVYSAFTTGTTHHVADEVFWKKDGTSFPVEYICSPIWEDGKLSGAVVVFKDITERKQADDILRRYEYIVSSSSDHLSFLNRDFVYQAVNSRYSEAFGKRSEEIVGRKVPELLGADIFESAARANLERCLTGETVRYQAWFQFPRMGRRFMDVIYSPYRGADGVISGIVVSSRDITEQKHAEDKLLKYSEELMALNEASNSVIGISGTEDLFKSICDNAVKLFKVTTVWVGLVREGSYAVTPVAHSGNDDGYFSELKVAWDDSPLGMGPAGMSIKTKMPHLLNVNDSLFAPWAQDVKKMGFRFVLGVPLIHSRNDCIGTIVFYSADPDFFTVDVIRLCQIFANQAATAIENAQLVEGLEEKISQRTRQFEDANFELQTINQELEMQRMEAEGAKMIAESADRAKSDFLANMSHELRTPLNSILGFSDMMVKGMTGALGPKQVEYLKHINESGTLLLSLINDILDLSKVEAGKMELEYKEIDARNIVDRVLFLFKESTMKHGIQLAVEIEEGLGVVIADERRIKQVLLNLLSNAVKFTSDNGRVLVSGRRVSYGAPYGECLEISVMNQGPGIKAEDISKLFKPFQQLDSSYEKKHQGTGLGLALCKRIVELHGGKIWVANGDSKETVFTFVIPVARSESSGQNEISA